MRIELVAGATNVVRFPVERRVRPTMDLLRELAPDVREAMNVAESFGLSMPEHDARHTADAEMADHIMNHVRPEPGPQRRASLEALLEPMIVRAVAACRTAHEAALMATEAQQRMVDAQSQGCCVGGDGSAAAYGRCAEPGRLLASAYGRARRRPNGYGGGSAGRGTPSERRGGGCQPRRSHGDAR
jgi:hypothetical protein